MDVISWPGMSNVETSLFVTRVNRRLDPLLDLFRQNRSG